MALSSIMERCSCPPCPSSSVHLVPAGLRGPGRLPGGRPAVCAGLLLLPPPEPAVGWVGRHPPQRAQPPGLQQARQCACEEWEVHPHGVQGGPLPCLVLVSVFVREPNCLFSFPVYPYATAADAEQEQPPPRQRGDVQPLPAAAGHHQHVCHHLLPAGPRQVRLPPGLPLQVLPAQLRSREGWGRGQTPSVSTHFLQAQSGTGGEQKTRGSQSLK